MIAAHDTRLRELTNSYDGVAALELSDGHVVLTARTHEGIAHIEVLDRAGKRVDDAQVLALFGHARHHANQVADRLIETAIAFYKLNPAVVDGNLSAAARATGASRETFYQRMPTIDVDHVDPLAA